jgi:sugar lactone lactonase YvrE
MRMKARLIFLNRTRFDMRRTALKGVAIVAAALLLAGCGAQPTKTGQHSVFYPALPQQPRVQYLTTITFEDDLGGSARMRDFLVGEQRSNKWMARPYAIAHEKDRIYVVDSHYRAIIVLDLAKRKMSAFQAVRFGALDTPMGMFIDEDGYKYVADIGRKQVVVYDRNDEYVRAYGSQGEYHATDVVVNGNKVYLCENQTHEVIVLDKQSGEVIQRIGGKGKDPGQFHHPSHLSLDKDGNLFVTDIINFRVQMFDQNGEYLRSFGEYGAGPGGMVRPKDHAISRDGRMYLSDAGMEIIQIFDVESADPLLAFGKYNTPGGTYMPYGVHIDYDNVSRFASYADPYFKPIYLIYVANSLGPHKLNVYAFGEWIGPAL